eukprot:CAMPEP_0119329942 /NCGR_PEP_ID=MMETSP1333-20130426/77103_1 /TAXON_ID=418940 /ORGANISM="Scyphosphaera apsteinii, Strain RCC1455" /LENGTH=45 /DNA_ID= /DNA_START= /DNA_END= /DNA_ORIENTATION=
MSAPRIIIPAVVAWLDKDEVPHQNQQIAAVWIAWVRMTAPSPQPR